MASVQCPRCSSYTANEPITMRGPVQPQNDRGRTISAYYELQINAISIVECRACGRAFVVEWEREVWPLSSPEAPSGVPEKVKEAYEDARLAFAAGANIGALMAARTTLVRFLRDKKASNFKELVERQIITPAIYGAVDQLRLWADVVGHEDIDTDALDAKEVEDILDYLATALEQAYTHQVRVDGFVQRTKQLKDKGQSAPPASAENRKGRVVSQYVYGHPHSTPPNAPRARRPC